MSQSTLARSRHLLDAEKAVRSNKRIRVLEIKYSSDGRFECLYGFPLRGGRRGLHCVIQTFLAKDAQDKGAICSNAKLLCLRSRVI